MRRLLLASLVTLVPLAACGQKADIVIEGGPVWTGLSTGRGQPGAVAIADGKILAVGDSAQIARYVGANTAVLHAAGGLVMPGFADGHTHFIDGGFGVGEPAGRCYSAGVRAPAQGVRGAFEAG